MMLPVLGGVWKHAVLLSVTPRRRWGGTRRSSTRPRWAGTPGEKLWQCL